LKFKGKKFQSSVAPLVGVEPIAGRNVAIVVDKRVVVNKD
jgi:hypothetical protein